MRARGVPSFIQSLEQTQVPRRSPANEDANGDTSTTVDAHNTAAALRARYETQTAHLSPEYHKALTMFAKSPIPHAIRFSTFTWPHKFVPFRHTLVEIVHVWGQIAGDVPCPIDLSEAEIEEHLHEAQSWQNAEDFRVLYEQRIGIRRDGWVPCEEYETAVATNATVLEESLELMETEEEKEDLRQTWQWQPLNIST